MKLANKVAVITGGNSGIGLATAREFRANGAKIVIFGRSRPTLDQAAASLGDEVLAVQGDVRKLGDIERLFKLAAERFGKLDVLVANAGIAKFAPIESLPEELFDELCDIHFKGTFFTVQKALPHLRDGASVIPEFHRGGRTIGDATAELRPARTGRYNCFTACAPTRPFQEVACLRNAQLFCLIPAGH